MTEEKYIFKRDREMMLTPTYWNQENHISAEVKKIYGVRLLAEHVLNSKGKSRTFFVKKGWDKAEKFVAEKLFDGKYFNKISAEIEKRGKYLKNILGSFKEINLARAEFKDLIKEAERIKKEWLKYDAANVFIWYVGGDRFKEQVGKKLKLPHDDFMFITTPAVKTAVSQMDYEILRMAKSVKEKKLFIRKAAEKLSENYGWIPFGYDGPLYWETAYFLKKLKKILLHPTKIGEKMAEIEENNKAIALKRNDLIRKYKLSKLDIRYIDRINWLAVWTDERKRYEFELHYYYSKILWELEKRYHIPYKNLKYLFTWELAEIKDGVENILKKSQWRINNEFITVCVSNEVKILGEEEKIKVLKELESQLCHSKIKGVVASRGNKNKYVAIARILNYPSEAKKIKKGEFLVTAMTTPDYILAMQRAGGFITDEGGVTCHAAIVAREMGKPCIIGTKNATKILKDGDFVEVDVDNGIVKIL